MKKIKFNSHWESNSSLLRDRVLTNFVNSENYTDEIVITDGNDYDYLICFNKISESPKVPKENIYTFIMEPSWSPNWDRLCHTYSNKVFCHDKRLFGNHFNMIDSPSYMFYHMANSHIDDYLKNTNFDKSKLASMIVSYTPKGNGDYIKNYIKRTALALKLMQYGFDIDIYGNGWIPNGDRIKGPLQNKLYGLLDYKFSISIENSSEKNYISEKFFDPILCNCATIYSGSPNIEEVYDHKMIIDIDDINGCLDLISDYLKQDVDYDLILKQKRIYFEKHNLYQKIKELIL